MKPRHRHSIAASRTKNQRRRERRKVESPRRGWRAWLGDKAPVLRFCAKFFGLLILFYSISCLPVCRRALDASTVYYARLASVMLNHLGESTRCIGATIGSSHFTETVLPECSAFEFPMFFAALVFGFPSRIAPKILGVLAATGFFFFLNLLRVTSLFLIAVHLPKFFTMAHERLWGTILIGAIVLLSLLWIKWAAPPLPDDPLPA